MHDSELMDMEIKIFQILKVNDTEVTLIELLQVELWDKTQETSYSKSPSTSIKQPSQWRDMEQ